MTELLDPDIWWEDIGERRKTIVAIHDIVATACLVGELRSRLSEIEETCLGASNYLDLSYRTEDELAEAESRLLSLTTPCCPMCGWARSLCCCGSDE